MNFYILLLILVISVVLGFIGGFLVVVYQFKEKNKKLNPRVEDIIEYTAQVDLKEDIVNKDKQNLFKSRVLDMDDSWVDIECSLDDISQEDYISKHKSSQDEAYRYTNQ